LADAGEKGLLTSPHPLRVGALVFGRFSSRPSGPKTHRLAGRLFKLSGAVILVGLAVPPETAFLIIMGTVLTTTLVTVVYSYFVYRAEQVESGR